MSKFHLITKCYRCGSTMELPIEGVRSDIFLCPMCLDSEIRSEVEQPVTQRRGAVVATLQNLARYLKY